VTFDLSETAAHLIHDLTSEEGKSPSVLVDELIRAHAAKVLRKKRDERERGE
jgi:hypothetical protein